MKSNIEHKLISKTGQQWTGKLEWSGASRKPSVPCDMIFFRFIIEDVPVLLNNRNAVLKCGRKATFYYEVNRQAVRKIKKALESAANSTTKIG